MQIADVEDLDGAFGVGGRIIPTIGLLLLGA
jgi:hypothetical protein